MQSEAVDFLVNIDVKKKKVYWIFLLLMPLMLLTPTKSVTFHCSLFRKSLKILKNIENMFDKK